MISKAAGITTFIPDTIWTKLPQSQLNVSEVMVKVKLS